MHIRGIRVDIKKAFAEGRYLEIIEASNEISTTRDKIILGMSLMKMGEYQQAALILAGIEAQIDEMVDALKHLGAVYAKMGEADLSRRCIERYIAFRPEDDEALDLLEGVPESEMVSGQSIELARVYAAQGLYEQSLDIFAALDEIRTNAEVKKEATEIQKMFIIKTLEEWLGRLKNESSDN
jgi:tetratricopeptide (TPR) repeat protein